ncbi:TRM11 family SAM-dependent methyltransferase [Paenibacillus prosopidis]|nr:RNA methyltransferase [Paenibacillus prosopidis]
MENTKQSPLFIYTFGHRKEELSLCRLEMRSFFGEESHSNILMSPVDIHPDRSPFLKERIEVMYEGGSLPHIWKQVEHIQLSGATFKVIFVKMNDLTLPNKIDFDEQRVIEREIGMHIEGEADVHNPDYVFGIITLGGRWYFGNYVKSKSVWLQHMHKPRNYSIALSTRLARAAANIAVPNPLGKKAIDPCCGIGTVLIEALSMGIDIVGRDINPFVIRGAVENMAHFGLMADVVCGNIADVSERYDVAIIDMPYNHYSRTTPEEQLSLLLHARRIASKAVIITADHLDEMIINAGFAIQDRCVAQKGNFTRQIIVCS